MPSQKSITFKYIFLQYIKLQNCWNYNYISQKYSFFYCIFNQINAALVSIRTFF